MKDCVFCKIIAGEIPAEKIYEDRKVLAFLDIKPINPGHVLVVSKEHYTDMISTPDKLLTEIISVSKKIGQKIIQGGLGEAVNYIFNNGRAAGQVIDHVHLHVIPRFSGDGYELWHGKEYTDGEIEKITKKLKISG